MTLKQRLIRWLLAKLGEPLPDSPDMYVLVINGFQTAHTTANFNRAMALQKEWVDKCEKQAVHLDGQRVTPFDVRTVRYVPKDVIACGATVKLTKIELNSRYGRFGDTESFERRIRSTVGWSGRVSDDGDLK